MINYVKTVKLPDFKLTPISNRRVRNRQILKLVTKRPKTPIADGNDYDAEYMLCPTCFWCVGENNFHTDDKPDRCEQCGQLLDWTNY